MDRTTKIREKRLPYSVVYLKDFVNILGSAITFPQNLVWVVLDLYVNPLQQ